MMAYDDLYHLHSFLILSHKQKSSKNANKETLSAFDNFSVVEMMLVYLLVFNNSKKIGWKLND